jgi:hypothetical protein
MKLVMLAVAGFAALGAGPAFAQYGPYGPPRPMMPVVGMPGEDVVGIVRAMGLNPVGPPMRSGNVYIQRAADYYGKPLRVIVDAHRGQVVSVEPLGAPGSIYGGPYAASGPYGAAAGSYGRRPYPGYGAMSPDDDEFEGPSGPRAGLGPMAPHADPYRPGAPMQQPARAAPKPQTKSAAVAPTRPPVPRKRPVAAPQETAGTVEPLTKPDNAAPQATAPQPAAAQNAPAAQPPIPPVAPLE